MAGHSKYANTKHRKSAQDAKRATVFSKLIREITHSAKQGGPRPEDNASLRALIDKALAANMKRETINKAVARGIGATEELASERLRYEGYGPGGVGIMVECITDNRNRTVAALRHAFSRVGCQLASEGSVAYLFERKGHIAVDKSSNPTLLLDVAMEAGADDVREEADGSNTIVVTPETIEEALKALRSQGLAIQGSSILLVPTTTTDVDDANAMKLERLLATLETLDDTVRIFSNWKNP